jgi:GNAT superfamily N-acetyltransferase
MTTPQDALPRPGDAYVLDHAAWTSLTGPHARFAEVKGQAARYPADVSPFVAVAPDAGEEVFGDLLALVGPGGLVPLAGLAASLPPGWELVDIGDGVQMIDAGLQAAESSEAARLQDSDVPEMLDLAERTRPGPFRPRTIEMGTYLGVRRGGALVAMAGERLHPPGWVEISAVCTDPAYRGRGLATLLVRAIAANIREQGSVPFLHAAASNANAIRLYESLGFTIRRRTRFQLVRIPAQLPASPAHRGQAGPTKSSPSPAT